MSTDFLNIERQIVTLQGALHTLNDSYDDDIDFGMFRSACLSTAEMIFENCISLIHESLHHTTSGPKLNANAEVSELLNNAVMQNLISDDACKRWLLYYNIRYMSELNETSEVDEETLDLLPEFVADALQLVQTIKL